MAQLTDILASGDITKIVIDAAPVADNELGNKTYINGKMNWTGQWVEGTSLENDVSIDGDWTGVANKSTPDRAAPQNDGLATWGIDPVTVLPVSSYIGIVRVVHTYTMLVSGWLQAIQVKMPNWNLDDTTSKATLDVDGSITVMNDPVLNGTNDWVTLGSNARVVKAGAVVKILFEMYHRNPTSTITGGWTSSIGTGVPAAQTFNISSPNSNGTLVIDHTDLDGTLRESELRGIAIDSIISLVETASTDRSTLIKVTSADTTSLQAYSTFTYDFVDEGARSDLRSGRTTTVTIDVPIVVATDYNDLIDGYNIQPSWANVTTVIELDGVAQPATLDAYGINLLFQPALVSDDWDLMSYSGDVSGSSSSTNINNTVSAESVFGVLTYDNDKVTLLGIDDVYEDLNNLVVVGRPAGKYEYAMSVSWDYNRANVSAFFRFSTDNGVTWNEFVAEPKDSTDRNAFFYLFPLDYDGIGHFGLRTQMRKETGAGTLDVPFSDVIIKRVG